MRAEQIAALKKDGQFQYHKLEIIEQISAERDRVLIENGQLKSRIEKLHSVEVSYAILNKSTWRDRTFIGICTFSMVVGTSLISAYPAGCGASWWSFNGSQLFAIGWSLVLLAGALQFFKAILGL